MQTFLWKVSLYRFLDSFKLIGAIFTLLFAENGLDVFQISVLIAIWSITQLLLEVPMGVIADKYPRRNVLMVATLLLGVGFALWLQGGFLFYALGMILWGVRNALTSGTFEAFVFDELKSYDKEGEYGKVNGRLEGTMQMGFMFSAILGGLFAQVSFDWVLLLTILTSVLAALVLLTINSVKPIHSTGEAKYFTVLKNAFKEIKSNQALLFLIIFISLTFGVSGSADEFWPLIFDNLSINAAFIGSLMALEFGVFALSGYSFPYVDSKLKIRNWHLFLIIISGLMFTVFGLVNSIILLPLVFIASYLLKLSLVKFDTLLQHKIGSNQRATVLSIKSLTFEIVYLLSLLVFGLLSTKLGVNSVIYLCGGR